MTPQHHYCVRKALYHRVQFSDMRRLQVGVEQHSRRAGSEAAHYVPVGYKPHPWGINESNRAALQTLPYVCSCATGCDLHDSICGGADECRVISLWHP